MLKVFIIQVVSALFLTKYVNSDIYSSISDIESLIKTHGSFINSLEEYLAEQNRRLAVLNKYLTRCKEDHKKMEESSNYMMNPINFFVIIKRLTKDLGFIGNSACEAKIVKSKDVVYPINEEFQGAVDALWRLQNTYLLNTTQLANGYLVGMFSHGNLPFVEETTPLTPTDCFELASSLNQSGNHRPALEWLLETYHKYTNNTMVDFPIKEFDLYDAIRKTYHALKDYDNALHWTKKLIELQPSELDQELATDIKTYEEELNKTKSKQIKKPPFVTDNRWENYEALCRGDIHLSDYISKNLKCYYKSEPEPFLKLARVKTEQLLTDPEVLMFHDVISDGEIHEVINLSKNKLARSTVVNHTTGKGVPSSVRTSKNAWLTDEHTVIARISQRVSDFTGLSVKSAEQLQVANYGIGGHYAPHYDYLKHLTNVTTGNRIATVLFYISDVEQGGATVFVKSPGLTVFPVKRSAIFWYNLLPSGEKDHRPLHAACPVLKGSKWVANKWIRLTEQEFRRPCTLVHENNENIV